MRQIFERNLVSGLSQENWHDRHFVSVETEAKENGQFTALVLLAPASVKAILQSLGSEAWDMASVSTSMARVLSVRSEKPCSYTVAVYDAEQIKDVDVRACIAKNKPQQWVLTGQEAESVLSPLGLAIEADSKIVGPQTMVTVQMGRDQTLGRVPLLVVTKDQTSVTTGIVEKESIGSFVGDDPQQWAFVATGLLVVQGITWPSTRVAIEIDQTHTVQFWKKKEEKDLIFGRSGENYYTFAKQCISSQYQSPVCAIQPNLFFLTDYIYLADMLKWENLVDSDQNHVFVMKDTISSFFPEFYTNTEYVQTVSLFVPTAQSSRTNSVVIPVKLKNGSDFLSWHAINVWNETNTGVPEAEFSATLNDVFAMLGLVKKEYPLRPLYPDNTVPNPVPDPFPIELTGYSIHVSVNPDIDEDGNTTQTLSVVPRNPQATILQDPMKASLEYDIPYLIVYGVFEKRYVNINLGFETTVSVYEQVEVN